jgi:hypothetical protein
VGFNLVERPVCESHGICIYVLYLGLDLYTVELYIVCTIYLGFEKGIKAIGKVIRNVGKTTMKPSPSHLIYDFIGGINMYKHV